MTLDQFKTSILLMGYKPAGDFAYRHPKHLDTVFIFNDHIIYGSHQIPIGRDATEIIQIMINNDTRPV